MMFPSAQPSTVVPLHGRNVHTPVTGSFTDKDPQTSESRHSSSPPTQQPLGVNNSINNNNDPLSDVLAVNSINGPAGLSSASLPVITPMMRTRDRICFQHLIMATAATAAVALVSVICIWRATSSTSIDAATGKVIPYTFQYFIYCLLGGVVAGTVHVMVTPIDLVKCRVQVGEYRSFKEGLLHIWLAEADRSVLRALPLFFRGWVPTAWGYCIQGALKFSLYEVFKFVLLINPRERLHEAAAAAMALPGVTTSTPSPTIYDSGAFQLVMFLLASALAEICADLGLAPWEAVKIRMQTSSTFSTSLRTALPRMWDAEGLHGFYKGLVPLWCRQVPYTMMKFASFEMIVVSLASVLHAMDLLDPEHPSTLGKLIVSLLAGMMAGVLCGLVSHPADTLLSKLNQKSNTASSSAGGINGMNGAPLLASTIAAARNSGSIAGGGGSGTLHDIAGLLRDLGWKGVWKGLAPRLLMVSTLTALQWVTYDGFKVFVGLPTSGGLKH